MTKISKNQVENHEKRHKSKGLVSFFSHFNTQIAYFNTPKTTKNRISFLCQNESGRSMVEILGVLAVVGVLSIGGITGYTMAMNKYRANNILQELNIASHQLATMLLTKEGEEMTLSLGDPYDKGRIGSEELLFNYGCGKDATVETECPIDETGYWMTLSNIPEGLCKSMMDTSRHMAYLIDQKVNDVSTENGANCTQGNNNQIVWFYDVNNESGVGELKDDETKQATDCGVNGTWNSIINGCACNKGWAGKDCSKNIEENCKYGYMQYGYCQCEWGWGGALCDQNAMEVCNFHGTWDASSGCYCSQGWTGSSCEVPVLKDQYCNYGIWNGTGCQYDAGYTGLNCEIYEPEKCGANRSWVNSNNGTGYCFCHHSGWTGINCSLSADTLGDKYCNKRGKWIIRNDNETDGYCQCNSGWYGEHCENKVEACSGNGSWYGSYCSCETGWGGEDCSQSTDTLCFGNGRWRNNSNGIGYCYCETGWGGEDCSQSTDILCSGHGSWHNNSNGTGYCSCNSYWSGENCSKNVPVCKNSNGWSGSDGKIACHCKSGWGGKDCSQPIGDLCSGNGSWVNTFTEGYCSCDSGWSGTKCSQPEDDLSKEKCSGNGIWKNDATNGYCQCNNGWIGSNCSKECKNGFSNGNICVCTSEWAGEACDVEEKVYCKHGVWNAKGQYCLCETDWSGENCDVPVI